MINRIDELINGYIDNELDPSELKELKELMSRDENVRERIRAMKAVDTVLRNAEPDKAPVNFTQRMMERLSPARIKVSSDNFIKYIVTVFLALGAALGAGAWFITREEVQTGNGGATDGLSLPDWLSFDVITGWLGNDNFLFIASAFTLVLMLTGYMVIENHKNFRNEMENMGH